MINTAALYRLAGFAAFLGGVLRIASAFPFVRDPISLEWLYTAIDVLLLFGLLGIYLCRASRLGFLGLASFAVAISALSFIGGPDADPFGFSTYEQGAATLVIGLLGLSIAWVQAGERPLAAPLCWFGATIAGGMMGMLPAPMPDYAFMTAGVLFGAGFVAAGWPLAAAKS